MRTLALCFPGAVVVSQLFLLAACGGSDSIEARDSAVSDSDSGIPAGDSGLTFSSDQGIPETNKLDTGSTDVRPIETGSPDASSVESGPLDSGTTEPSSPYSTDSRNCGAVAHDCLGATCTAGVCESDVIRQGPGAPTVPGIVRSMGFDEAGMLITLVDVDGKTPYLVRRGPVSGPDTTLFTVPSYVDSNWFFFQGALFSNNPGVFQHEKDIERFTGSNGGAGTPVTLEANGRELVREGSFLFYQDGTSGLVCRIDPVGAGKTCIGGQGMGQLLALATDPTYLYAANSGTGTQTSSQILRIPRNGANPRENLGVTGISKKTCALHATSTRLVGTACSLTTSCGYEQTLWSTPLTGGQATVLATPKSRFINTPVAGDYLYWLESECFPSKEPDRVYRRRTDGSDSPLLVAQARFRGIENLVVEGAYLYYLDENASIRRVAR